MNSAISAQIVITALVAWGGWLVASNTDSLALRIGAFLPVAIALYVIFRMVKETAKK